MNKAKFVSILFIIFLFGTLIPLIVAAQPSERNAGDGNFTSLKKGFLSPGKEYGSAPLWVWHTRVTKEIIDSMMAEFKQNEFGGVMIHPRPGLITE